MEQMDGHPLAMLGFHYISTVTVYYWYYLHVEIDTYIRTAVRTL